MIVSAKGKIAAAIAIGALLLMANEASAQHRADSHTNGRHRLRTFEPTYGYVLRQVPRYDAAGDVYFSNSLGYQPFPNPDRDFSIRNLRSHPSN